MHNQKLEILGCDTIHRPAHHRPHPHHHLRIPTNQEQAHKSLTSQDLKLSWYEAESGEMMHGTGP